VCDRSLTGVGLTESLETAIINRKFGESRIIASRRMDAGRSRTGAKRGNAMKAKSAAGALAGALLIATALSPVRAADMTNERALNPQREPQNWILHHGNYEGHRFSQLKEINTETVKNLKPMFTVALSGFQSGGRYPHGNLEATPLVEDGIMYVPDGWRSAYAIDLAAGKKGGVNWKSGPRTDSGCGGDG